MTLYLFDTTLSDTGTGLTPRPSKLQPTNKSLKAEYWFFIIIVLYFYLQRVKSQAPLI